MEITNMTFVTLPILCVIAIYFVCWLFKSMDKCDKENYSTLNKPLKNNNKPWYNK